jgi:hypothetical protein
LCHSRGAGYNRARGQGVESKLGTRRVSISLALSLAIVGCSSRFDRGTLPLYLSDEAFWTLVTSLSEVPGTFSHSDNLVSNEILIPHTVRQLRPRGGVYIGVGPEQNFSYIARLEPAMAFIIDIRQENRNLHLLYKALFELSADRVGFVSRLFSRDLAARPGGDGSVHALFEALHGSGPSSEMLATTRAAVRDRLLGIHRLPLSAADLESIDYTLTAFYRDGPDIAYRPLRPSRERQPSYQALMTAPDFGGHSRSYLSSDGAFRFIKTRHEKNLIVPVVGDFGSSQGAISRVGEYIRRHGTLVSAFYGSNVQTYLSNQQLIAFCRNLAELPVARNRSVFIHNEGPAPFRDKLASCDRRATR